MDKSDTEQYLTQLRKQIKQKFPLWKREWEVDGIDAVVFSMVSEDVDVRQEIDDLVRTIIEEEFGE